MIHYFKWSKMVVFWTLSPQQQQQQQEEEQEQEEE